MRHAEAEMSAASGDDYDRALTDAGRSDAALVGSFLEMTGLCFDAVLASASVRTRQTVEALGALSATPAYSRRLYNASADRLREEIAAHPDAATLLIVAHNPGVHQLAVELVTEGEALPSSLDRLAGGFPPGTAAVFEVDERGRARLERVIRPDVLAVQ
ncbi:histidine phosphatase family protein [Brevundimonas sp. 2R-24]|uniref:Histidine phosphatase family protein n=1 Tax=Peiella sedimenti TaxID=3061083 RepID=A0ABT8SNF6_9CAUL|nr:histidine phosphatase family protein [Caulobacteraceae bacterium XZ-24]